MRMDYSTIEMHDNEMLPPCSTRRYILVLRGGAAIHIENREIALAMHDIIIVPPETDALFRINPADGRQTLLLGCIEMSDTEMTSNSIDLITAENTELVRRIFYLGLDVQDINDPYYDSVNSAINQLMFSALIAADLKTHAINPQVYAVITDINKHFTDVDYNVREVIDRTGYSVNHFRKLFREEVGLTPTEFVTLRRLDKAVELFQQFKERIPVKEIARQCGYQDPFYFSRQFKNRFKMSPQQYVSQL